MDADSLRFCHTPRRHPFAADPILELLLAQQLLTRPVGRPSYKPVVRYRSFFYRAASWKRARRVVAKVELHFGELFPGVGFIVPI
jgi:hypothetical protein